MIQKLSKKPVVFGFLAGIALLGFYFLFLSLAQSLSHAREQFLQLWYWILILVAGFGIQVGLYTFIRQSQRISGKIVATSGGISTGSMIVCCLHHLVDVLPIVGLAAMALFLVQYQVLFIVIGILSNLIGTTIMLEIIQKNQLAEGFLKKILVFDMNQVKKIAIGSSLVLFLITFFLINISGETNIPSPTKIENKSELEKSINLPGQTNNQNGISFEVTPLDFSFDKPTKFEIKIDTHSGSLDFDLLKISILEDDRGNEYQPLEWQGPPPGGHHLAGILIFPKIDSQTKKINLAIQDSLPRVFEWNLKQ